MRKEVHNMGFLRDGLSIQETKISALVLAFIVTLGFALWQLTQEGTIDGNLLILLGYEIGAVAGINIADKFKREPEPRQTNSYNDFNQEERIGG